ncbi:hypothetical protein Skr01_38000 [Sphaerisporangium krabiense]|uniref:DUF2203 domain-containing protein n=1 Tax=Sphaerisporangium krabiense TaxID=763782 RepID=A0A7W9DSE5_9ACTN|nr:DUF2203 domain-containing protein [Sphaerisporangium krabiense]MBB5629617.1 hypothetical protein [Sphaerisporangium krabiense]GII63715.1 hypothetical protein Skr01_38000 [Sphaerisporangium krabiense]
MVNKVFTVEEARGLMPELLRRAALLIGIRADLAELGHDLAATGRSHLGGIPEAKAMEARVAEVLGWFDEQGIEVKGVAPLLADFPAVLSGESVRLCWIEGETALGWYHRSDLGFPGRRPLP